MLVQVKKKPKPKCKWLSYAIILFWLESNFYKTLVIEIFFLAVNVSSSLFFTLFSQEICGLNI